MIVKNSQETIKKADEVSTELLKCMLTSTVGYDCEDDPAEQIYFASHCLGSLLAKVIISLDSYAKTYGIQNMTPAKVVEWVSKICMEHVKASGIEE